MTAAQARQQSPAALAERLLGPAGASQHIVEAKIFADGGLMIRAPGLNRIDLYGRPEAIDGGLCQVKGISVDFGHMREAGDEPHRVKDFWPFTRFFWLGRSHSDDRACAALSPAADRRSPRPFALDGIDSFAAARFAVEAVNQARSANLPLDCAADARAPVDDSCHDPRSIIAALSPADLLLAKVERCPRDGRIWCVKATWEIARDGNESRTRVLRITTDCADYDPPGPFRITALALTSETWIED